MKEFRKRSVGKFTFFLLVTGCLGLALMVGCRRGPSGESGIADRAPDEAEKEVQWWTCSMHPQIRLPEPGLCPICNMPLIPLTTTEEDESAPLRQLTMSEAAKALAQIETSPVERKFVTAEIRMVGKLDYDETRLKHIAAWVPGRLDRLYVDSTGVPVQKGEHLVDIYSPELYAAQEELLQARRALKEVQESDITIIREITLGTVQAARERLRLWGITEAQVAEIEKRGKPDEHMTIYAPIGGIVIHKNAVEGMYVSTGTHIYTIADLSRVWAKLDAYESDLMWIRPGQRVEFTTEAYPGELFVGRISLIHPVLDERTRTVKLRVTVDNPKAKLKPGMFVRAVVRANVASAGLVMDPELAGKWICSMHPEVVKEGPGKCDVCGMPLVRTESLGFTSIEEIAHPPLVIPASAPLITGTRAIVYVAVPGAEKPTYEGREIVLGPRAGDYYLVKTNLEEGELVVTRGNFKIDSALQLLAKPSMMLPEGGGAGGAGMHHHAPEGEMPGASMPGMEAMLQVPAAFRSQLRQVEAAYGAVSQALEDSDLEKLKSTFAIFAKLLETIDKSSLSGRALPLWNELAMHLMNDGVEGRDVKDLREAQRVFAILTKDIRKMQEQFRTAHAKAQVQLAVPEAFQRQIGKLWEAYAGIQTALAGDDFEGAAHQVDAAQRALAGVDMKLTEGEAHNSWMKGQEGLAAAIKEMEQAGDIGALRAGFALLSEELPIVLRTFGMAPRQPVYELHCPMAFGERGANWLQGDRETRNPYFGAAMLKCGNVIEDLSDKMPTPTRGDDDE